MLYPHQCVPSSVRHAVRPIQYCLVPSLLGMLTAVEGGEEDEEEGEEGRGEWEEGSAHPGPHGDSDDDGEDDEGRFFEALTEFVESGSTRDGLPHASSQRLSLDMAQVGACLSFCAAEKETPRPQGGREAGVAILTPFFSSLCPFFFLL